jgi:hypothetical protein
MNPTAMTNLFVYGPLADTLFLSDLFLEQAIAKGTLPSTCPLILTTAFTKGGTVRILGEYPVLVPRATLEPVHGYMIPVDKAQMRWLEITVREVFGMTTSLCEIEVVKMVNDLDQVVVHKVGGSCVAWMQRGEGGLSEGVWDEARWRNVVKPGLSRAAAS